MRLRPCLDDHANITIIFRPISVVPMHSKIAAIAGATGQDGAHLAGLLLAKAMSSMVSKRRSSSVPIPPASVTYSTTYSMMFETGMPFHLHYGDLTDGSNLIRRAQD